MKFIPINLDELYGIKIENKNSIASVTYSVGSVGTTLHVKQ